MSKSFKIARKPGQATPVPDAAVVSGATAPREQARRLRSVEPTVIDVPASSAAATPTTRKTIEVPGDYFYRVKMRALERHMLEKELWAEIVREYFINHPTL